MRPAQKRSLMALARVQKRETDMARMTLARHVGEERRIEEKIASLKATMQENRVLVSAMREETAHDLTLWNGYRYWLPVAQEELDRLEESLATARERSEVARMAVRERASEQAATGAMVQQEKDRQDRDRARQEQVVLDEQASQRARAGRGRAEW